MYPWWIVNLSNSTFYIKITTSFVISELFGFYSSLFGAIVVDLHCLIRRAILIFHEQWEDFACLCVSWFYALVSWYDYVPLKFSYRTCLIRKKTFFLSTWGGKMQSISTLVPIDIYFMPKGQKFGDARWPGEPPFFETPETPNFDAKFQIK